MTDNRSLNEILATLGYTTAPAGNGKKHIIRQGETVFTSNAFEVSDWLDGKSASDE